MPLLLCVCITLQGICLLDWINGPGLYLAAPISSYSQLCKLAPSAFLPLSSYLLTSLRCYLQTMSLATWVAMSTWP